MVLTRTELVKKFIKKMGKNFVTPNIIGYYVKGNRVIEFSKGEFLGKPIFGVTVRDYVDGKWKDLGLSKPFHSRNEAESYIYELKRSNIKLMKVI